MSAVRFIASALFSVVLLSPIGVSAQLTLPNLGTPLIFSLSPEFPTPNNSVTVTAQSFSTDLSSATISWYVNGSLLVRGVGRTSVDVATGDVGTETIVAASIATSENTTLFDQIAIRPTSVSLLWEANSYTPPFYKGRALPSAGTIVRAEARSVFTRPNGSSVPRDSLLYTWKKNGQVIAGSSGKGKWSMKTTAPALFGEDILSVTVESEDRTLQGNALVRIPSTEPVLTLYEDSPLLGVTYYRSLSKNISVESSETTFALVPFFTSAETLFDRTLLYTWKIDGVTIPTDSADPFRIILTAPEGVSGTASLDVIVEHISNFFQTGSNSWTFSVSEEAIPTSDPFRRQVN